MNVVLQTLHTFLCPWCGKSILLDCGMQVGDHVSCPNCDKFLKVSGVDPAHRARHEGSLTLMPGYYVRVLDE